MSGPGPKTKVFLTVDVECAEEREIGSGQVQPALDTDLRINGILSNQNSPLGIPWIMGTLEKNQLPGVFFVESLSSDHFGIEPLRGVCESIRKRGHDVQLHLHPILRHPNWLTEKREEVEDDIGAYSEEEQTKLLREGIQKLVDAGVPRKEIVGFRAGNYGADNRTWKAMATNGLTISSNYNPSYLGKSCHINWPTKEPGLFDTGEKVFELPISNLEEGNGYRHLQITAVTASETQDFLLEAHKNNISHVTIVTHSFEFFHLDDANARTGRPNRLNQHRWRSLCRFLGDNRDRFSTETIQSLAKDAIPNNLSLPKTRTFPRSTSVSRARRLVEQAYKRLEARIPI